MAYRVAGADLEDVLVGLDHREQGGYDRVEVELHFVQAPQARRERAPRVEGVAARSTAALMYVATESNPNYLGRASLDVIARQVMVSRGPSGPNPEYVHRLAEALLAICPDLDAETEEVLALARLLREQARARATEVA
jgi:cation transport regulator ChaC